MINKTFYIIGGSGLIGLELIKKLQDENCNIIVLDIKKNKNFKKLNIKFKIFDCTNLKSIKKNLNSCFKLFGKPDILINCSYPKTKDWNKIDFNNENQEILRKNVEFHLSSYTLITQIIANKMKQKGGSIINISSIYGKVGQDSNIYKGTNIKSNYIYSTIKSGIIGLTKSFAAHYGKYQIRINCISPGGIIDDKNKTQNKNFVKNYSKRVPLRRMANVKEVVGPILFLTSEDSSYITGTNIMVDGGWTCI